MPVSELFSLRGHHSVKHNVKLTKNEYFGMWVGNSIEITGEFKAVLEDSAVLHLQWGSNKTLIGYDPIKRVMFIDRTKSGESGFHSQFAGRQEAPLLITNGKIRLRAFVDHSSVELFGNDGEVVITDRIFPSPNDKLNVYI